MKQEEMKDYAVRVSQANRSELVVIIYELILKNLQEGKEAFQNQKAEDAVKAVKKAKQFLDELKGSLDFQYDISFELLRMYRYVYEQLVHTIIREEDYNLDSAIRVMSGLKQAFEEVAKQDHSEPVMQNTQQVYAGLTYGKGTLNEFAYDGKTLSRGFIV